MNITTRYNRYMRKLEIVDINSIENYLRQYNIVNKYIEYYNNIINPGIEFYNFVLEYYDNIHVFADNIDNSYNEEEISKLRNAINMYDIESIENKYNDFDTSIKFFYLDKDNKFQKKEKQLVELTDNNNNLKKYVVQFKNLKANINSINKENYLVILRRLKNIDTRSKNLYINKKYFELSYNKTILIPYFQFINDNKDVILNRKIGEIEEIEEISMLFKNKYNRDKVYISKGKNNDIIIHICNNNYIVWHTIDTNNIIYTCVSFNQENIDSDQENNDNLGKNGKYNISPLYFRGESLDLVYNLFKEGELKTLYEDTVYNNIEKISDNFLNDAYSYNLFNVPRIKEKIAKYYGFKYLFNFYLDEEFLNYLLDINNESEYISFINSGNNFASSINNFIALNYAEVEDEDFSFDTNFPKSERVNTKQKIKIALDKNYRVLGRTVYIENIFDRNLWLNEISKLKKLLLEKKYTDIKKMDYEDLKLYINDNKINVDIDFIYLGLCIKNKFKSNDPIIHFYEAYKIQKVNESLDTLMYEMKVMEYLHKNMPEVFPNICKSDMEIYELNLSKDIKKLLEDSERNGKFSIDKNYYAVKYCIKSTCINKFKFAEEYMEYLENCEKCPFSQYSNFALKQVAELLNKNFIHSSLVNIYHSMDGDRKYLPSAGYLNVHYTRYGSGRLNSVIEAAEYSNIRYSGLADFAEIITMEDYKINFINQLEKTSNKMNQYNVSPCPNRIVLMDALCNQFLSWYIILTKYCYNKVIKKYEENAGKDNMFTNIYINGSYWYIFDDLVNEIKEIIKNAFINFTNSYLNKPIDDVFSNIITDQDLYIMAKQLVFFTSYEYVYYFKNGIYDESLFDNNKIILPELLKIEEIISAYNENNNDPYTKIINKVNRGWVAIVFENENNQPYNIFDLGWCLSYDTKDVITDFKKLYFDDKDIEFRNIIGGSDFDHMIGIIKSNNIINNGSNNIEYKLWKESSKYLDMGAVNGSMPHQRLFSCMYSLFSWAILSKFRGKLLSKEEINNSVINNLKLPSVDIIMKLTKVCFMFRKISAQNINNIDDYISEIRSSILLGQNFSKNHKLCIMNLISRIKNFKYFNNLNEYSKDFIDSIL